MPTGTENVCFSGETGSDLRTVRRTRLTQLRLLAERSACHHSFCQRPVAKSVVGVVQMPSTSSTPCRKIKAFPEFSIDRTKVIFADRSTSSLSGDLSPQRLSHRERSIRWRRLQRRGRGRTRLKTGSRRKEG